MKQLFDNKDKYVYMAYLELTIVLCNGEFDFFVCMMIECMYDVIHCLFAQR